MKVMMVAKIKVTAMAPIMIQVGVGALFGGGN